MIRGHFKNIWSGRFWDYYLVEVKGLDWPKSRNIEYNNKKIQTKDPILKDWPLLTSATRKTAYQMFSKRPQFFVGLYASIVSWTFLLILIFAQKTLLLPIIFLLYLCYSVHTYFSRGQPNLITFFAMMPVCTALHWWQKLQWFFWTFLVNRDWLGKITICHH